ncbi:uncharacterized protein ARMOST_02834 [Armillaria ostoyae]|uniref:Uncharacterized protein n=1 Tax=Armillaria ostoyae TaxID=47428 RepID=A0A284QST7_ARMOS|nr:uncharacterized protein ARMOST_02834 [Armillaria ostoyae]
MANAAEFFLGAEPLLFKIRGGPVPPYYQDTNKHLQDLADVYAHGPRADPHIHAAWRIYYHIVQLRDMLDDEAFRTHMRQFHSAPYEMLGVRGSVLLWRKLKEDAKRWDNADGPGSLKKIGDDARRQEREDGDLYVSDEEIQPQRKDVTYLSGDEAEDAKDVDTGGRKTVVRRVIPMDPMETNGSKDKGRSRVTRSKRALGKRSGADVHEIDEARPKKKLRGHLSYRDVRLLSLPEREKYLMSILDKSKARTRLQGARSELFYAHDYKSASEPGLYPVSGKVQGLFNQESSVAVCCAIFFDFIAGTITSTHS